MNIRYGYFRVPTSKYKRDGVICIQLQCPNKEDEDQTYRAAICVCSPRDTFSKTEAHKRTTHRLSRPNFVLEMKYEGKPPRSDFIMRDILRKAVKTNRLTRTEQRRPFIPLWAVKSIGKQLFSDELKMGLTGGQ